MHCTPKSFIQAHVCGRTATQCQPVVRFQRQTHILECSGLLATSCFLFNNISSQQNSIYFNGKEPYAILLLVLSRNHPVKNCSEFTNLTKDWFVICTLKFEPPFRILFPSGWVVFFHLGNFLGGLVNFWGVVGQFFLDGGSMTSQLSFALLCCCHTCLCLAGASKMLLQWPQTKYSETNCCQKYICGEHKYMKNICGEHKKLHSI